MQTDPSYRKTFLKRLPTYNMICHKNIRKSVFCTNERLGYISVDLFMHWQLEINIKGKDQSRGVVQNRSVATRDTYQKEKMALRSRAILPKKIMPKQNEIYSMYVSGFNLS